jgi:tRNA uracil 4-sulfurtransferase
MDSVVIHYQEIALKGANRPWFISRLVRNLRRATSDLDVRAVRVHMGRIELVLGPNAAWADVKARLEHVFGIANFARARRLPVDLEGIASAILSDLGDQQASSFRVSARRADKRFPMTSPQIEREVGGRIKSARGWKVDLSHPELEIHVDILTDEAFCYFGKDRGPGGLPTGVSGRVACLLSGGIDSPVAAWRMMKRGCSVLLIHFHSYPILSRTSQEKAQELAALLTRYQQHSRLYLVAFGDVQRQVVLAAPEALRVVLYRRLMMRIAQGLAEAGHAKGLVTGDVVGQVASQTLDNMAVIGSVVTMPIYRPLIGMDKEEITAEARRLGTYPISIVEDEDCCQLFTPRHPATSARLADVEAAERGLPTADLVRQAVESASVQDFDFPGNTSRQREGDLP